LVLLFTKIKVSLIMWGLILLCIGLISVHLFFNQFFEVVNIFRYYFGFIFFFLFFKSYSFNKELALKLVYILIVMSYIEFIYINFIGNPYDLNVIRCNDCEQVYSKVAGWYRSYGFSGTSSSSSVIISIMIFLFFEKKKIIISVIALLPYLSGAGIFVWLFLVFFNNKNILLKTLFMFTIALVFFYWGNDLFYKISPEYIKLLFDLKWMAFTESHLLFFGNMQKYITGGDFGILGMINDTGVLGLLLFFFIIIINLSKYNFKYISILLLASFHYPVVFFVSGQIILGYLLSCNIKSRCSKL